MALTLLLMQEERRRTEQALHENARLLSSALDAEISRSITAMHTLSRNESLRRDDLRAFYEAAKDVRDSLGLWDNVLLLSPRGDHLFNLMRPFGTALPPVPQPEGPVTASRTRAAYVSNALRGRVDTDWLMFMNYPVEIDGEVKYVLGVTMNYRYWSRWLTERAPKGFIASITDRNHVVLARTQDAERLAGQPVQPWFRDVLASREGGTVRGQGLLDPDVVVAFHRSALSGWRINLLTSGQVVDGPGRRTAYALTIGVAIALAIAAALALWRAAVLARSITGVIGSLQSDLRAQNRELSEADRRKDEFLATLAHELRNPLAPIRSAVELLGRPDLPRDAARKAREIIERQARHMTRMVDDLLEVGRITRGELQLRKEIVEVAAAVHEAVEATQPQFNGAGVALAVDLPATPLYVDADPTRLVQIMTNLLGNAAKYTPRGGHVRISTARADAGIELRVRDDGIGIDASQMSGLFRMFSQAKPALEHGGGGLGIGLALVRGLVERHGGTVEARSDGAGRGAEFIVRLPASEAPEKAPAAPLDAATARTARRVLVVDDNRDAADSLAALMRTMGHEVHIAYDGEQGLAAASQFLPEAIVLDIGMPRVNGYEVARRVRQAQWGAGITLIALTGWGQQQDKALAAEAGFDEHLTKPVDAAALDALLSK